MGGRGGTGAFAKKDAAWLVATVATTTFGETQPDTTMANHVALLVGLKYCFDVIAQVDLWWQHKKRPYSFII